MKKTKKLAAYKNGLRAEALAGLFLMLKGCRILARRYKTPVGEIDLIAKKGKTLIFIEVKARAGEAQALEAVSPHSQARIMQAALHYIAANPHYADYAMRFDVAAFHAPFGLRYLDNAWQSHT